MAHTHSANFFTRLWKRSSGDLNEPKERPSSSGAHERFLENEGLLQPAGPESVQRPHSKHPRLVPREDTYIPRSSPAHSGSSCRKRSYRTPRHSGSVTSYELAKPPAAPTAIDKYIYYPDDNLPQRSGAYPQTKSETQGPVQPLTRTSFMRRLRSTTLKSQQSCKDSFHTSFVSHKALPSTQDDWPYSEDYVPAPAPTFGEIPGFGIEKARPPIDLSSGAAARAAAAAQNEILEKMRRMNVGEDTLSPYHVSTSDEVSDHTRSYFVTSLRRQDPVQYLPREIMSEIFACLDPDSLLNAELVSHNWHAIASSSYVWKQKFYAEFKSCQTEFKSTESTMGTGNGNSQGDWKARWRVQRALAKRWLEGKAAAIYLEGHTDSVYCVQFDKEKIVTGSRDRTIRIWSMQTWKCMKVLGWPRRLNHEMEPLPDESEAGIRPFARIHPPRGVSPNMTEALPFFHTGSILCLHFDDRIMVTGSSDNSLIVWEARPDHDYVPMRRLVEHTHNVLDVIFDQSYIVSCSKDKSICIWNRHTGDCLRKLTGHNGPVNAVKLNGELLVSVGGDSVAKLWNVGTGDFLKEFNSHKRGLACVEFSQDSRSIFTGGNNKVIYEFDLNGNLLKELIGHRMLVRSVDANSGRVVSGSYDSCIKTWNQETGNLINSFPKWTSSWILSTKADYRRIIATSQDSRVFVMDFGYDLKDIEFFEN